MGGPRSGKARTIGREEPPKLRSEGRLRPAMGGGWGGAGSQRVSASVARDGGERLEKGWKVEGLRGMSDAWFSQVFLAAERLARAMRYALARASHMRVRPGSAVACSGMPACGPCAIMCPRRSGRPIGPRWGPSMERAGGGGGQEGALAGSRDSTGALSARWRCEERGGGRRKALGQMPGCRITSLVRQG